MDYHRHLKLLPLEMMSRINQKSHQHQRQDEQLLFNLGLFIVLDHQLEGKLLEILSTH